MVDTELRRTQERRVRQEGEKLQEIADQIKKPSKIIFIIVLTIVLFAEIIDIISAVIVVFSLGSGTIVSETTSFIIDVVVLVVLIFSGYISSRHLKQAHKYRENIGNSIQHIEKRIASLRQSYAFKLKAWRKNKVLRRPLAKIALKFRAAKLLSTKNPTVKYVLRTFADWIPIISAWPFRTIAVIKTYKEEKLAYEHREEMHDYWMMANAAEVQEEEQILEQGQEQEEEQATEESEEQAVKAEQIEAPAEEEKQIAA